MSGRPLVSVITGTWQRHDLLLEMIEHLRAQTYRPLEHVIVSDGPDDVLRELILEYVRQGNVGIGERRCPVRFVELGRHWTAELSESFAAAPFIVGQFLACGEYACLWADDERATPEHIEKLVDLIEATGVDFVYPSVDFWWRDRPNEHQIIGMDPPQLGSITHWLYRPSMIECAGGPYATHTGRANDWEFVRRAILGGASWAWLEEVTFSHRADA